MFGRPPPSVKSHPPAPPLLPPQRKDKIVRARVHLEQKYLAGKGASASLARVKHNRRGRLVEFKRLNPISRLSRHIDWLCFTTLPPKSPRRPFSYPSFLERSASCHHLLGPASLALRHVDTASSILSDCLVFCFFFWFFFYESSVVLGAENLFFHRFVYYTSKNSFASFAKWTHFTL